MDTLDSESSALRKLPPLFEELLSLQRSALFPFDEDTGETRSVCLTPSLPRLLESADPFD